MKTKHLRLAAGVVAALAISNPLSAQNTSYNANTTPIGGSGSAAFGVQALNSNTGIGNVGIGFQALYTNTSASYSTAVGYQALYLNNAEQNSAFGFRALKNNTTGNYNTATGLSSLYTNGTGSNNTANGHQALYSNYSGYNNTAMGYNSLYSATSAYDNTVAGHTAMYSTTTGGYSVANGAQALYNNTTGSYNVAIGWQSLYSNISGNYNVALGYQAMYVNTGSENTALGFRALKNNSTGNYNTGSGLNALYTNATGSNNAAHGYNSLYTNIYGSNNTGLGYNSDVSSNSLGNATAIGASTVVNASNKVRIGNSSVTVIEGQVPFSWVSDARFKENVTEEVKGLEFIKLLRPVVYNFNSRKFEEFLTKDMTPEMQKAHMEGRDFDKASAVRQTGFIAQEVEQAAKKANYDFNGVHVPANENDNYSIAYAEFVVPLVKGMQEQQVMIEEQQKMIEALQAELAQLQKGSNPTGVGSDVLNGASMEQNVPNPFSRETVIGFNLPQQVKSAHMIVYDLSGKQLKTIAINERGASSITITADDLAAGMYIYTILADGQQLGSKRMIVSDK
jgi:hypothetical protein